MYQKEYIYCIKDPISFKVIYIGRTYDFEYRKKTHLNSVDKNGTNIKKFLFELKVKKIIPIFEVLEVCNNKNVLDREAVYLNLYKNESLLNMRFYRQGRTKKYDLW